MSEPARISAQQLQHCLEIVKTQDHDRYLSCLFAASRDRPALAALNAFHCELARARAMVSEPMLAEIRLTWWREAIEDAVSGVVRASPLVEALAALIDQGLAPSTLTDMVDARLDTLAEGARADAAAVTQFCRATSGATLSAVFALQFASGDAVRAATGVGTAIGLVGLIQSVFLDASLQHAHGQSGGALAQGDAALFQGQFDDRIQSALDGLGQASRQLFGDLTGRTWTRRERRLLVPAVFAQQDLAQLEKRDFDPLPAAKTGAAVQASGPARLMKAWWFIQSGRCL